MFGVALPPEAESLYSKLNLLDSTHGKYLDIRDYSSLSKFVEQIKPEIVIHLAAQPLVIEAYKDPLTTFETNILGTANTIEAALASDSVKIFLAITTDKVYENQDRQSGYIETDPLGGDDPYSASKSAAEMVVRAYQKIILNRTSNMLLFSARAGNVIGGGDYAKNRIIPDIVRSLRTGNPLEIRNPNAVRPWQHVLEPLDGYLQLIAQASNPTLSRNYNFGPSPSSPAKVRELLDMFVSRWDSSKIDIRFTEVENIYESDFLLLNSSLAKRDLDWYGKLTLSETIDWIIDFEKIQSAEGILNKMNEQIQRFFAL